MVYFVSLIIVSIVKEKYGSDAEDLEEEDSEDAESEDEDGEEEDFSGEEDEEEPA